MFSEEEEEEVEEDHLRKGFGFWVKGFVGEKEKSFVGEEKEAYFGL